MTGDTLSATDQRELAAMHCEVLPESLVSRLGEAYARSFYRYVEESPLELAFVDRDDGELLSACIVSLEPQTMQKRLLTATPLVLRAPLALNRLPLWSLVRGLLGKDEGGVKQPPGPEVLLIFTTEAARGRGLGKRILARCEQVLRAAGHRRYHVKTADAPSNRAIAFYEREGFEKQGAMVKNGKRLVLLSKDLQAVDVV